MRRVMLTLAGLAVVLVTVAAIGAIRVGDGLVRTTTVVDDVPLTLVRPASGAEPRPGAVVVHGFAGSARLMQPFADTLARNGYVVVLPDLAGHGASGRKLADPLPELDVAVRSLRARSDVDPSRIVLIGHSRGAAAVTAYGAAHREIAATVALSLGQAPARLPRNLLLLYGQFEVPIVRSVAREALALGEPGAAVTTGQTYGSVADGTGRRAEAVPGVEHVSILFAPVAHARTLAWIDAAVRPGVAAGPVHPFDRLWPAGLLLLGLLLGFAPLAALVLRPAGVGPPQVGSIDPVRLVVPVLAGLAVAGVVGLVTPDPALDLAVGGYTAIVLLAFGLVALLGSALGQRPRVRLKASMLGRALLLATYSTVMVVGPIQAGLTWVAPSPSRLGPGLALLAAAWTVFAAAERLGAGRWYLHAAVVVAPLGVLLALVVIGFGPGFLALILPLLAALLAIGAGTSAVLRRLGAPPWLAAAVAAPPFAWTVAATLPLA